MDIPTLVAMLLSFIDRLVVPLIFAIAFIVFIWGIFVYFIQGGADEEKRAQGRQLALWGIIGFAIMMAVWGLVFLLTNTLRINPYYRPTLPSSTGIPGAAQQQQQRGGQVQTTIYPGGTQGSGGVQGGAAGGGLPAGAICSSRLDSECSTGECDWSGQTDARGQQVFVCVAPRSNN